MSADTEWKLTKPENPTFVDRKCGSDDVVYRKRESYCGGYDYIDYKCRNCGRTWTAEGADS